MNSRKNSAAERSFVKVMPATRGQALIVAVIFFSVISLAVVGGIVGPTISLSRLARTSGEAKLSYVSAESVLDDSLYRLKTGKPLGTLNTLQLNGETATAEIVTAFDGQTIKAKGAVARAERWLEAKVTVGAGASFNFGVQADTGGLVMENNSSVNGNIFANGSVVGANSNLVRGNAVSAGPSGLISGVHATGSAYAKTIQNSVIDKDAYYQVISGTTVGGAKYPGSPYPATTSLPISDALIEVWKTAAASGTNITAPCPYRITGTATIGPAKINCDLEISGNNYTLTLNGPLWVTGNINIKNGPTLRVVPSLGNVGVAIVADNPNDRLTSSQIILDNSSTFFQGSGGSNSYILLISQNQSAESGDDKKAIDVGNSASGALLVYAGHGEIFLHNSVNLKQVTGYRIRLQNYANVTYETGLISAFFDAGPSGGWQISHWTEIP